MKQTLNIILSPEALTFVRQLPFKVQQKVAYNIRKVESGVLDSELFKKLENTEIWELRTLYEGLCCRLFGFWDHKKGALVIVTHGIVKKTQKTPQNEILKAEAKRKEYFNNNNK